MAADEREGLYRRLGTIRLGGVIVPLVEPATSFDDHGDLDRAVCAAGLAEFARRPLPCEQIGFPGYVLVREVLPGVRLRLVFEVLPKASA
jgi:hypothetical protein